MREDFGKLLRELNQARKDYWYEGEEIDPDEVETFLVEVETLVEEAEADQ